MTSNKRVVGNVTTVNTVGGKHARGVRTEKRATGARENTTSTRGSSMRDLISIGGKGEIGEKTMGASYNDQPKRGPDSKRANVLEPTCSSSPLAEPPHRDGKKRGEGDRIEKNKRN